MKVYKRYEDVKSGAISQAKFLDECAEDIIVGKFISRSNTFEQAISILKSRDFIFEEKQAEVPINFFQVLQESISAWEGETKKDLDISKVNGFEFDKGWRYEFIKAGKASEADVEKAKIKAIKNLEKDAIYYTKLELVKSSPEHSKERSDQHLDISKGQNLVDLKNQSKPVKLKDLLSTEDYMKAAEEKENLNEGMDIDNEYGTDEIRAILEKWSYLGRGSKVRKPGLKKAL